MIAPRRPAGSPEKKAPPAAVETPGDLGRALAGNAGARAAWDALPPSHKREYLAWIDEAKRPETRARRIDKTVENLAARG